MWDFSDDDNKEDALSAWEKIRAARVVDFNKIPNRCAFCTMYRKKCDYDNLVMARYHGCQRSIDRIVKVQQIGLQILDRAEQMLLETMPLIVKENAFVSTKSEIVDVVETLDVVLLEEKMHDDIGRNLSDIGLVVCVRDQVNVMRQSGMMASAYDSKVVYDNCEVHMKSGSISCAKCEKMVIDYIVGPHEKEYRFLCLGCAVLVMPDVPNARVIKDEKVLLTYCDDHFNCRVCARELSVVEKRKKKTKCAKCRLDDRRNVSALCFHCGKSLKGEPCNCHGFRMASLSPDATVFVVAMPRSYDCVAPCFQIPVDRDYEEMIQSVDYDPGLVTTRQYQIGCLCKMIGCVLPPDVELKLWSHSIRDLYGYFSNLLKDPDRCLDLRNLPRLTYEANQVRQIRLIKLMMENRCGRTMFVGKFNSEIVRNVEFLEQLIRIPTKELQSRRIYDSVYVFDQSYVFDLQMLRRTVSTFLKSGGTCRVRIITATNDTILWNYAMECALQSGCVDNLVFRDLRVYGEYFGRQFDVKFAQVSSVGDYFMELRWKTLDIGFQLCEMIILDGDPDS